MQIIIHGTPVPQARMRHSNFRGFVTTYDPNAKDKKVIREFLKQQITSKVFEHPRVSFVFYMPIPKTIKKKDTAIYNSGTLKHEKKPDVDNLIKLYLDCLDNIIIFGDQKVSLGPCVKIYDPIPRTVVTLTETTEQIMPWEFETTYGNAI